MITLKVNAYGLEKAKRFRRRFALPIPDSDQDFWNVHDYLHTVTGAMPVYHDEQTVIDLQSALELGLEPVSKYRGLKQ